jgi:3-methyl-2-oxobutanoate hydroxymethyltransferase
MPDAANSVRKTMTVPAFRQARERNEKLVVVTAYDYTSALLADRAGLDALLVGDSLGMVVQGLDNPLPVTLGQMVYHTRCVARARPKSLIIADLPFLTYQVSPGQAVRNAGKLLQAGAQAVKLEGGTRMLPMISACIKADIPMMGHIGLTPQSLHRMGGFRVQRDETALLDDARALDEAGVFALVVEGVPADIAAKITAAVTCPTIGIGAGPHCSGQVLVWHDLLGLYDRFQPKFVKRYADLGSAIPLALEQFREEVKAGRFPGPEHTVT